MLGRLLLVFLSRIPLNQPERLPHRPISALPALSHVLQGESYQELNVQLK